MKSLPIAFVMALLILTGCSQVRVLDSPKCIDVLNADPVKMYAGPVFYFCPMDVSAVPFLMEKIADPNVRVRTNAVNLLGKWLITPEAVAPFQERYFNEPDVLVRKSIVDSLEKLMTRPDEAKDFIRKIAEEEQNPKLSGHVRRMLEGFDKKRSRARHVIETSLHDPEKFKAAYDPVYRSSGKEGDLDLLLSLSCPDDENALKALRIKILKRNTDKSLFNYQKINSAILRHRYNVSENTNLVVKQP